MHGIDSIPPRGYTLVSSGCVWTATAAMPHPEHLEWRSGVCENNDRRPTRLGVGLTPRRPDLNDASGSTQ